MQKMSKILMIGLLMILFSAVAHSLTFNDPTTIVYWSFDNDNLSGSDPLDRTSHNHNGSNTGATTNVTGILNEAFDYPGSGTILLNDSDDLDFDGSENFSYTLWVDFDTLTTGNFLDKKNPGSPFFGYFLYSDTSGRLQAGARAATTGCYITTATGEISTSGWHFIAYTRDVTSTTARLYVNNIEIGTVTNADCNDNTSNTEDFNLGNGILDGQLDEFSLWNKTLSVSEISELYNGGAPTSNQQFPFVQPPINESTESLAVTKQSGSVSFTSGIALINDVI